MLKDLNGPERDLAEYMSEISERCYYAGWMKNLEFVLWDATKKGKRIYGHGEISEADIKQLKHLSLNANCWIVFDDEKEEIAIPLEKWENLFSSKIQNDHDILNG